MRSFNKNKPNNPEEKLIVEMILEFDKAIKRFLEKSEGRNAGQVFAAMQSAVINFMASVTKCVAENLQDKSKQLDFIEIIRTDVNGVLDEIKKKLKTVELKD